jgi:glycosyltransferase involved in cell wall biosynthesis
MQPYSALPDFIRSSDICINPFELNSITEKILPTKLFQYLGCGKPVVATRLPGTVPFLSGEEDGVLYTNLEDTVPMLAKLLSNPVACSELGTRGVTAARRYDWTEIAKQMASWLQELAAQRSVA